MVKPAESAVPNLALSDLRDAQGWSQEEEAERLNELARAKDLPDTITANAVSRWERGIVEVPIPMHRQLLAELFGVSQQELGFTRPRGVQPDGSGARDQTVIRSQREWLRTRQALNRHRSDLTRLATRLYPPEVRVGDTGAAHASGLAVGQAGSVGLDRARLDPSSGAGDHRSPRGDPAAAAPDLAATTL